jgi:hypothetical protein
MMGARLEVGRQQPMRHVNWAAVIGLLACAMSAVIMVLLAYGAIDAMVQIGRMS